VPMPEPIVRAAAPADFDEFMRVSSAAFLQDDAPREAERFRRAFGENRFHVALDEDEVIGTCGWYDRRITVPGADPAPVAAVTAVTVKPGHRRRGALTRMMRTQLDELHAGPGSGGGPAIAALWASEGGIYGRFGYAPATHHLAVEVPTRLPFRPGVDLGPDRVLQLPRTEAMVHVGTIYEQAIGQRAGRLERDDGAWELQLADGETQRDGSSPFRFAVHPDGYAVFRTRRGWNDRGPAGRIDVHEMVTTTPTAAAAVWRYLLDYDLVTAVHAEVGPDDPIRHLLADPRQAVGKLQDGLWVRLVDIERALGQRTYPVAVDAVLEVSDGFCPWNAGRWRVRAAAGGAAEVSRSSAPADLALDVGVLGAAFLGGPSVRELADAGWVREGTAGAVAGVSRAFGAERVPHCPELF
jgi:predicted acetyltransferase